MGTQVALVYFHKPAPMLFVCVCSQQGFGVLSVALACRALTLMTALLDDLQVESSEEVEPSPAGLNILTSATALQRAARIFCSAPLNQFFFYLATVSYRKVQFLLRCISK